jgi:uncharacterized protein
LTEDLPRALVQGTAVFSQSGRPCRLDYRIDCDAAWRTRSARVEGWFDTESIDIDVAVDATQGWTMNGRACDGVQGCIDIDLDFSPVTNLLPIRRRKLAVGERVAVRAAWLRFPSATLEPLDQIYERLSDTKYRYESAGGAFVAVLDVNAVGLVTRYQGIWESEP